MDKFILSILLLFSILVSFSQNDKPPKLEPYFTAVIVEDIETSISWYSKALGFKIINQREISKMGFKQANLKCGDTAIELIELDKAISPKDIIPNYNSKTRIQGLFKVGFWVSDFDLWLEHLTTQKVNFHGRSVKDPESGKRMIIIKDPDGNKIQLFEK